MSPTVGSGGSLDIANNYFIPAGSQTCDQLKIVAESTGTVKIDNNKFVTPVAAYSQECSMLTLAGTNRPTPSIEVVNNYFETRALRLPYQLIRTHSNDINIASNTFVSQKAGKKLEDLVAIFAVAGSKPQLGANDFKQFQGLEIYYQQ